MSLRAHTAAAAVMLLTLLAEQLFLSVGAQAADPLKPASPPIADLRRVFHSSFAAPVAVESLSDGRTARLTGTAPGGAAWDSLDHIFNLVAPAAFGNQVTLRLDRNSAPGGKPALFLRQNQMQDGAQARLQFFGDDTTFGTEILTRRTYFIPGDNLASLAREDDAVSIAGTREIRGSTHPPGDPEADFSLPLYLVRRGADLVFAQAIVDYSAGPNWSDWTRHPRGLLSYGDMRACPLDRWFTLDVYVRRHPTEGALKVWLDGALIFDLRDVRTKNDTSRWFTKLADVDTEPAPFELWVGEVEIWAK